MLTVTSEKENGLCTVRITGKVDSTNAAELEARLTEADTEPRLVIDAEGLEYISSAGLRVFLKLRKAHADLEIKNASTEVYEILDMTGFTEMIAVSRAYRRVSVEGCEIVGQGAKGAVYRLDPDTVVKVYLDHDALADIEHERDVARKALILGVPTAISYDVVKVDDHYASMFEMINAKSFSKILSLEPENTDKYARIFTDLLKQIHAIEVPEGQLPHIKVKVMKWADDIKDVLPADVADKLHRLASDVPDTNRMIHGDYHTKNVMLQNDEAILIDMDTLSVGHPIAELAGTYCAFQGFSIVDRSVVSNFLGIPYETATAFWKKTLEYYYDTTDAATLALYEDKIKLLAFAKLTRHHLRHNGSKQDLDACIKQVCDLTARIDSLI